MWSTSTISTSAFWRCWVKLGKFSDLSFGSDSPARGFSPSEPPTPVSRWSKNIFRALSWTVFSSKLEPHNRNCDVTARRPKLVDRAELIFGPFVWVCCICQCYRVFSVARIVNKALRSVFGVFRGWAARRIFSSFHTFSSAPALKVLTAPDENSSSCCRSTEFSNFLQIDQVNSEWVIGRNSNVKLNNFCFVIGGEEVLVCEWNLFLGIQHRLIPKCVNKSMRPML